METTAVTTYTPPGPPTKRWRDAAEEWSDQRASEHNVEFDWYFDPSFPVDLLWGGTAGNDADLWEVFTAENEGRTGEWEGREPDDPLYRKDEMFYDTYWGWWNTHVAYTGMDCPVVVFGDDPNTETGWSTWDGWHRMLIARLARIKTVPAIVGIRKDQP